MMDEWTGHGAETEDAARATAMGTLAHMDWHPFKRDRHRHPARSQGWRLTNDGGTAPGARMASRTVVGEGGITR